MKPITPLQAGVQKSANIPAEVIQAFNELIVKNLVNGYAHVKQSEVTDLIISKFDETDPKITRTVMFNKGWLDVEPLFREAGWKVVYDKPAYNETYEATFYFEALK